MSSLERRMVLSDDELIKVRDAVHLLEVLDSARPGEMTEVFYVTHFWELLESLRDVLELLDVGSEVKRRGDPSRP